ncbi:Ribonuclease BN [Candidatus Entotheonellaceae bacterium PAL068K]
MHLSRCCRGLPAYCRGSVRIITKNLTRRCELAIILATMRVVISRPALPVLHLLRRRRGMELPAMYVRFWGTRGSVPTPGPTTVRYGGNTSCVEVRAADGSLVVLDCGTGAIPLGRALLAANSSPMRGTLLIGHTHWDHIQGFPFFAPFFVPGSHWKIYGPAGLGRQIERSLAGQMAYETFPLPLDTLQDQIRIRHLMEGVFEIGSIRVTTQYLNHPVFTLGYRLEADGATLVYATDYEPFSLHPLDAPPGTTPLHPEDRRHVRFLEGADLIIHDAQYTLDDFPARTGWGHMPLERVVDYALLARAGRLALFHHDPTRDDTAVEQLHEHARTRAAAARGGLEVYAAAEGQVITLPEGPSHMTCPSAAPAASALRPQTVPEPSTVLLADADPAVVRLFEPALRAEGLRVLRAADGATALQLARQEHPAVILLDMTLRGIDGLAVCRTLRAATEPFWRHVPIVLLTGVKLQETDLLEAFAAGATDYLVIPAKPTLLRSRVRIWLQRTAAC